MKYKLITDKKELQGTCYFEFLPGKYQNKCWNVNSVYLTEESLDFIEKLLINVNPEYDHFSFTEFSSEQVEKLINELKGAIKHIENNKYVVESIYFSDDYNAKLNEDLKNYRDDILKLIEELIIWMKETLKNNDRISILGI